MWWEEGGGEEVVEEKCPKQNRNAHMDLKGIASWRIINWEVELGNLFHMSIVKWDSVVDQPSVVEPKEIPPHGLGLLGCWSTCV